MKELGKKSLNGNIADCEYCDVKSGFKVCSSRCNKNPKEESNTANSIMRDRLHIFIIEAYEYGREAERDNLPRVFNFNPSLTRAYELGRKHQIEGSIQSREDILKEVQYLSKDGRGI